MATKAFILIEAAVGKTKDVMLALRNITEIKSVDVVTGPYDIILVVERANLNAVSKLITEQIHSIPGVNRTVSCVSIDLT